MVLEAIPLTDAVSTLVDRPNDVWVLLDGFLDDATATFPGVKWTEIFFRDPRAGVTIVEKYPIFPLVLPTPLATNIDIAHIVTVLCVRWKWRG